MDELDLTPEVIQRSEVTRSFATVSSFTVLPMMASQKSIAGPITSIVVQCSTNALRFVLHRSDMLQRQAKYSDVASSASKVEESKSTQHKSSGARYLYRADARPPSCGSSFGRTAWCDGGRSQYSQPPTYQSSFVEQ
jgi:hypothetical protein